MRKLLRFLVITFLVLPYLAFAQTRQITGTVTDEGGNPLAFVSVVEKGTKNGTTTNDKGQFSLSVTSANPVLTVSYTGRQPQEIAVGANNNYTIALQATGTMAEVVVTALGIRREQKELGYSAQQVNVGEITETRQTNIVNALQGRATGLQINSTGGAPGQGARIIMRGVNSLDPNRNIQPFFVVDGIPIDNSTDVPAGSGQDLKGLSNRAADINPDDIESITVLKGGAATALYGIRAANGAIIITTKSGRAGRVRINLTSTYGVDEVDKFPDTQKTFTQGYSGVYDKTSFWPSWGPTVAEAKAQDPTHPDELFNNYKRGYQDGYIIRNTLSLSGGTDVATFAASLSQLNQQGVLPFSDYQNYGGKVSSTVKISEKIRFGASANYINSGGYRVNADRYNEQLSYWAPRWDVMDYETPEGTMKVYGVDNDNPMFVVSHRRFKDDVNRFIGNVNFSYTPINWLDISYRFGGDIISDVRTETAPGPKGLPGELYPASDFRNYDPSRGLGGFVEEYRGNRRILNSTAIVSLSPKLSDNISTSLKLGHDLFDSRFKYVYTIGDTLSDPTFYNLNNARKVTASNYLEDRRIVGVFGDLTLGWKDFLYLTLTARNDWTSTLPEQNRSFFYPSASVSYVLSQHLTLPDWISFAKVRGSVAKIGKDAPPYSFSTGFIPLDPPLLGGLTLSDRSGDPNLKPEFTTSYEGGVDARFLQNRIGVEFTYYNNTSKDLIIPVAVTTSSGLKEIYLNAGSIRNKGVEISLYGTPVRKKDFNWDVRVNYTHNDNEVLEIYPGLTEVPILSQFGYLSSTVTQKFIPGMPVGALFGRSYARYYGTGKEDPIFIDYSRPQLIGANGFPVINTKQMYLGNSQPDWIGSIYNDLRYKQFSLSFLFDAQQGLKKYNQMANFMAAFGIATYTENRRETVVFEGVKSDGSPNTKPVWLGQGVGPDGVNYGNGFYRNVYRGVSENFVEDASFVKLRNVTIAYQLPESLLHKTKFITGASIALSGNNLWLSTDYTGFDPESSSNSAASLADGFAGFTYPATRSYMVTLNLSF
ncbi:SusC/RagA family TonB-linked outer membrane protein [Flavisolibacter tropicus]|uniref:TonB-dependent receptor n=1 Tax=Flavisolibacter tropicus TaxID=1492898 RepID=A0A172TYE8_9BACT|nr:SusC/RagA family TonB-linked outer membrane protein [Flavisolibacter tropicus]ANE52105.1 TonB-dependent receptor [Flavisolibacter tropicus]